jgi:hypothetical protein
MSEQVEGSGGEAAATERRRNQRLRTVFDTAFVMIEPFFDPAQGWGGHSLEHLAFRVVRENFPELTSEEVHSLVVAAHRVYIQRNPSGSDHLPRPDELRRSNS